MNKIHRLILFSISIILCTCAYPLEYLNTYENEFKEDKQNKIDEISDYSKKSSVTENSEYELDIYPYINVRVSSSRIDEKY